MGVCKSRSLPRGLPVVPVLDRALGLSSLSSAQKVTPGPSHPLLWVCCSPGSCRFSGCPLRRRKCFCARERIKKSVFFPYTGLRGCLGLEFCDKIISQSSEGGHQVTSLWNCCFFISGAPVPLALTWVQPDAASVLPGPFTGLVGPFWALRCPDS